MRPLIAMICLAAASIAPAFAAGCGSDEPSGLGRPGGEDPDAGGGPGPGTNPPTPPASNPPPQVGVYKRGSLNPVYQLLSRNEYGRIAQGGVQFQDTDYTTVAVTTSAASKMDEIGSAIAQERGLASPVDLMPDPTDRQRSQQLPFRGNPSDVKLVKVGNATKAYLPLGGDVMTPGNEVVSVTTANGIQVGTRIKVGIHPQRIAIHPAGLVFVCNQYSNYISIIDPANDQLLTNAGKPVEIKTEYSCADMIFVPKGNVQDVDHQYLYVANRWRHSVLKYSADIVRDPFSNKPIDIVQSTEQSPTPASKPVAEILGAGANPFRLSVSEQQDAIYVANNKGGELARIDLRTDKVTARVALNAPTVDVVNINDLVYVATTTPDRGLLSVDQTLPAQVAQAPVKVRGLDEKQHVAFPGALRDKSRSYNFEDLRNGLFQVDFQLQQEPVYYTDDVSTEPNYVGEQKVLSGAIPTTVTRNAAGTLVFLAMGGSDVVQELRVNTGARPFTVTAGRTFRTKHRPFALALDEQANQLFVADWGQDELEVINLNNGNSIAEVDLGYAQPAYPATNIERGELFFYNADWSNNGRKSCATCHIDELDTDGIGYSNGASAPTAYHQVKPNHNLATTDSYFWNGAFGNGNYTSVAFAAQTRSNCEVIELALVEGPGSNPAQRVGDANNFFRTNNDNQCRPVSAGPSALANQAQINQVLAQGKALADAHFVQVTGLDRQQLSRVLDFYSVAELRLPPNPLHYLKVAGELDTTGKDQIDKGKALFTSAGCASCHTPDNTRHPFSDGLDHGPGADWAQRFVDAYSNDPRVLNTLGQFPQTFLQGLSVSRPDRTVNIHSNPLDFFIPFCFDVTNCLQFDDPLTASRQSAEETRRLNLIITVNLQDPDREFIPGNVMGQAKVNTPSLRGVWTQANLLHSGLAHTISEAILAPGHPGLHEGETGFATDESGVFNTHGATKDMSKSDVEALIRYVENIE